MNIHMYACIHTFIRIRIHLYIHIHIYAFTYIYVYLRTGSAPSAGSRTLDMCVYIYALMYICK